MEKYNTEKEIWKDAVGYEGFYQVSNLGRVRSVDRTITRSDGLKMFFKGGIRRPTKTKLGYLRVTTSVNGKYRKVPVHRMVAKAFIPNPNNYKYINHKDEDKSNNAADNLEWCTAAYNNTYGTRIQRVKKSEGFQELHERNKKPVAQYSLDGEFIKEHPSYSDAAREIGADISNLGASCIGQILSSNGFIWIHRSDDEQKEVNKRVNRLKNRYRRIKQFDMHGNFIAEYPSMYAASRKTGINRGRIFECCRGKRESFKGYRFEYAN